MPSQLAHALFWVSAAACAVGQGALLWMAVRRWERASSTYDDDRRTGERRTAERWAPDRRAQGDDLPEVSDSRWRELTWALLPAIGLTLLLAATWAALP